MQDDVPNLGYSVKVFLTQQFGVRILHLYTTFRGHQDFYNFTSKVL